MVRFVLAAVTGLGLLLIVLLVGALLVVGGLPFLPGTCSEEERKVYAEFPQFGNVKKEPEPFSETGGCAASYETSASQERVAEYYMEQLRAHGWKVEQVVSEMTLVEPERRTAPSIHIMAQRDGFFYEVMFESLELYDPPRPGVHVAVHVFDG